jgi:hypothetical protein
MKLTDKIEITNEDNMVLMARYPDKYFDLAIVDPPYGIGFAGFDKHYGGGKAKAKNHLIMNILLNYLEFLKIKLFGVQIILLVKYLLTVVVGLFGIKLMEIIHLQMQNLHGLHLKLLFEYLNLNGKVCYKVI